MSVKVHGVAARKTVSVNKSAYSSVVSQKENVMLVIGANCKKSLGSRSDLGVAADEGVAAVGLFKCDNGILVSVAERVVDRSVLGVGGSFRLCNGVYVVSVARGGLNEGELLAVCGNVFLARGGSSSSNGKKKLNVFSLCVAAEYRGISSAVFVSVSVYELSV